MATTARIHAVADGRKSLAKPMKKVFWMMTVPLSPMSSSTAPFQASRPASVTTKDGTPSFVMITPCSRPMPMPAARASTSAGPAANTLWLPGAGSEHVVLVGEGQQRDDPPRHTADVADRQVDLAQQQHEDDPHADGREGGRLDDEVDEVASGEEVRVLRLEDDPDDDQADDDRQRAQLAGLDADPPAAGVVPQALRADGRGGRRARAAFDRCGCGGAHAITSSVTPGTFDSLPAVIASTTCVCVTSVRLYSPTFWARRSTVMLSATSKMSCRLWEMSTTARPCSPRRLTRSSTCRVWPTPRAAVLQSRITTF